MISKNGSNTIVRTVRVLEQVYSPQLDNQRDILVYLPPEYNQSAARYPVIIIHQDPVLSQVKLIAEPWDVGPGGYQVGNFPVLWAEWNGKYRDTVRRFWKGDEAQIAELAYRLSGSSDLYENTGRQPYASINFITAHDGFTLRDLVSYDHKHNQANGEDNRDGENHNNSWNC